MNKIITKQEFKERIRPVLKKSGKTIALCHGVFDLVHPGHIIHLKKAKEMADILVVSVTASQYVRKGPGRPYFDDEMRMRFLEALEPINYVMLSEGYTVDDIIESVEPDIYVKGEEYAKEQDDITGMIVKERELVEAHGGKIGFTNGKTFSSTKLINTAMSGLSEEVLSFMKGFKKKHSIEAIRKYADEAARLKVLVIGDVIIDQYTYCQVQGMMSKDMGYSARLSSTEDYLGGALAIARHLSSFTENVSLMSIIGIEEPIRLHLFDEIGDRISLKLVYSHEYPTIIKHRYLMKNQKREEYRKIFAVNNIPERPMFEKPVYNELLEKIDKKIDEYDLVFVCDFGHGLVNKDIMELVQNRARFLALNCQTNSTNRGFNVITKYHRADFFACDQTELKLAFPDNAADELSALNKLCNHLKSRGILTRGSEGAIGMEEDKKVVCPAVTLSVKDTVGAGDALFAVAGLYAALKAPIEIITLLGNIGGALGANIIGNKEMVEKVNVLKYANTLMNV